MPGDWIAMRIELSDEPEVIRMGLALKLDPDEVVGKLLRVWGWFDSHTADGNAPGVTRAFLDRYARVSGFAAALRDVGWLEGPDDGVRMPKFDEYCGHGGKKRLQGAKRTKLSRKRNAESVTKALPQNRTEQNRTEESSSTTSRSPDAGGSSTTKATAAALLRLSEEANESRNPHRPFFDGEVPLAARDSLIATWNATPGRRASGRDCRGLAAALYRIASAPDVPPLATWAPLEWLTMRVSAYVRSLEATRDGGRWKCTLGNFLDKDKWQESDEAWAFRQPDAGQESESDRTIRKLGLQA